MKRLNHLTLILCLLGFSGSIWAQKISGSLVDGSQKPQEFATLMLLSAKDSSLVKGAVTDFEGKFEIENAPAGRFFLRASLIGFKNSDSPVFDFDGKSDKVVSPIVLQSLDQELKVLTVTAQKPMIEVKADRTVFNIENTANAVGLNALELLRKSPGIQVDKDENVLLKGKSEVIIYINGKPSQMNGRDLAAFLKGLNSADIEAIEIISNPGAKFDAEGNAGIINIRLKKNKKLGTNGNVSLGVSQGITPKTDAAFSLNHRDKKWSVFSNYSYNYGTWNNTMYFDNLVRLGNGQYDNLWVQQSNQNWTNNSHNFKVGADWNINSKNTLGFIVNGGYNTPSSNSNSSTVIGRAAAGTTNFIRRDSVLRATTEGAMLNKNLNYNLNYRLADTSGLEWTVDADYGYFLNDASNYLPNIYRNGDETVEKTTRIYRNMTLTNIDIKTLKSDFEMPLSKTNPKAGKLGLGFKLSDVQTSNDFDFYNVLNGVNVQDTGRTNYFTYTEQIQAIYGNYNTQLGKWGLQLGLRGERTVSKGDLRTKQSQNYKDVDTNYINLFPTMALSYALSDKHSFNVSYRYALDRPSYQDLNPFENRLDELTYERGNTTLRPQYTHNIEVGYTLMGFATLSVNYAKTKDFFTQYTDQDVRNGVTSFFITKANLANREQIGLSFGSPTPIKKWWNGYVNAWFNRSMLKANLGAGKDVDISANGGGFYVQQTFSLGKGWSAEADGFMNFGGLWGNFVSRNQGMLNVGMSKKFWDGDATVKVAFSDVLGTAYWKAYTELGSLYMNGGGTWEGRQLRVNFSYRFGNKQVQMRQRKTGLEAETGRIKSGKG